MKRSKIATFKIKETPNDKITGSKFQIGDTFSVDFDMFISNINEGFFIHKNNYKFYLNELYIIKVMYIDKYDVDPEKEINEFNKYLNEF